ncbi:MAG: leucine-rich repeat domain-containing protein [bacterium]|nr:leucine-rich repeat domain-containing protein [bacterium]
MGTDLELIKRLEEEIGDELVERRPNEIMHCLNVGFALNADGEVTGLNLNDFEFSSPPESINKLRKLERLSMIYSQINDLSFLRHLTNLSWLDLRHNNIRQIPDFLLELGLTINLAAESNNEPGIFLYDNPLEEEITNNKIQKEKIQIKKRNKEKKKEKQEPKAANKSDKAG